VFEMAKRVRLHVRERARLHDREEEKPKSKMMAEAPKPSALFGEPLLLPGEDAVAYEELWAGIRAAAAP
jgi:hypothetical protein